MSDDISPGEDGEESGGESRTGSRSDQALEVDLSLDAAFELLCTERRREVIRYLYGTDDDVVSVSELADHVAAEMGDGIDDRERAEVSLHHRELPKLDEAGLIDYDPRSRTIRYWGDSLLEDLLTTVVEEHPD